MKLQIDCVRKPITISILGVDGVGKTTQVNKLQDSLVKMGHKVAHIKFASENYRKVVTDILNKLEYKDRSLEFIAAALEIVDIIPGLISKYSDYDFIIFERYKWCRIAVARVYGCKYIDVLRELYSIFKVPDINIFLDAPIGKCMENIIRRNEDIEYEGDLVCFRRYYEEELDFRKFEIVDASGKIDDVTHDIQDIIKRKIGR